MNPLYNVTDCLYNAVCHYTQIRLHWLLQFLTIVWDYKLFSDFRVNNQLDALFSVFISLLYMFRATQCSSSGESILSIHHAVGMQVCRYAGLWPAYQTATYHMMYWHNWFSWWWALGCSKHVEKWNKHTKKCVKLVFITNCTDMRGQQNNKCFCTSWTVARSITIFKFRENKHKQRNITDIFSTL